MRNTGSHRSVEILALLLCVLVGYAGQTLAATCKQPSVSFSAGKLTISSEGCSLHEILAAVGRESGIKIEQPPTTATVPLFADLGPGDPKRILSALLDGVPFNWTLVKDETDPAKIIGVVVGVQTIPLERPRHYGAGCVSCPVPPGVDPRVDTPPRPPLCTSEFTKGNREASKVYCIWDMERIRPNNVIR